MIESGCEAMRMPGLSVEEVFKSVRVAVRRATGDRQTPWESSSLVGQFHFTGDSTNTARLPEAETNPITNPIQRPNTPTKVSSDDDEPNLERIEIGKSKRGSLAEGQHKEYGLKVSQNTPLLFVFQVDPRLSFSVEIYDPRGVRVKQYTVGPFGSSPGSRTGSQMAFTPQSDGQYTIKLTGGYRFGNYAISVSPL